MISHTPPTEYIQCKDEAQNPAKILDYGMLKKENRDRVYIYNLNGNCHDSFSNSKIKLLNIPKTAFSPV